MTSHSRARHAPVAQELFSAVTRNTPAYRPADPVMERERAAVYQTRRELPERLTAGEAFWYVLGNIWLAGMYFAKLPAMKAMEEAGLVTMSGWGRFWYYVGCVPFGQMYMMKVPVKRVIMDIRP